MTEGGSIKTEEGKERLNWMSPSDYEQVHDSFYPKKYSGTEEWLLQTVKFEHDLNTQDQHYCRVIESVSPCV